MSLAGQCITYDREHLQSGPLIVAGGVLVVLLFYHLDKQYPDIMKELIEREAKGEL